MHNTYVTSDEDNVSPINWMHDWMTDHNLAASELSSSGDNYSHIDVNKNHTYKAFAK